MGLSSTKSVPEMIYNELYEKGKTKILFPFWVESWNILSHEVPIEVERKVLIICWR